MANKFRAVLWDFGGVFTTSPLAAFRKYEKKRNLPSGLIGRINTTNPNHNAWAKFERGEIDDNAFDALFLQEARALGHEIRGAEVLPLLRGTLRSSMVAALKACREAGLRTGCITNNMPSMQQSKNGWLAGLEDGFEVIIESSKAGVRKPEPAIYQLACKALSIEPQAAVYLDDLGVNLKPARAMGMHTIKVGEDESPALAELGQVLNLKF